MMEHLVETVIDGVTVFRTAAIVTRSGRVPEVFDESSFEIIIDRLPLVLMDGSLRAQIIDKSGAKDTEGEEVVASKRIRFKRSPQWSVRNITIEVDKLQESRTAESPGRIRELENELHWLSARSDALKRQMDEVKLWMGYPIPRGEDEEKRIFPFDAWNAFIKTCARELEGLQKYERELHSKRLRVLRELEMLQNLPGSLESRSLSYGHYCKNARITVTRMSDQASPPDRIELSYIVPGARWLPAYKLYIFDNYRKVRLVMGAQVTQRSGEDWVNAKLNLSAAMIERIVQLPELPSRRIGREQLPATPSYRDKLPPSQALFAGFDDWLETQQFDAPSRSPLIDQLLGKCNERLEGLATGNLSILSSMLEDVTPAPPAMIEKRTTGGKRGQALSKMKPTSGNEERAPGDYYAMPSRVKPTQELAPPPVSYPSPPTTTLAGAPPPPEPPPGATIRADLLPTEKKRGLIDTFSSLASKTAEVFGSGEVTLADGAFKRNVKIGALFRQELDDNVEVLYNSQERRSFAEQNYFHYELESVESASTGLRGQLRRARRLSLARQLEERESDILRMIQQARESSALPVSEEDSGFQCVFEAQARATVPGDGYPHLVDVMNGTAPSSMSYRTIPMTDPRVFGRLIIGNPFDVPLPGGAVQVFVDNSYMFNTPLKGVGKGGEAYFPLGAEPRIRVSRNTQYREQEKGIAGGNISAVHEVEISLRSHMSEPATVEVIDRAPVKDENEKKIDIKIRPSEPEGEEIEFLDSERIRGAHRWSVNIDPGRDAHVKLEYEISFPSKMEVIGGNRRV